MAEFGMLFQGAKGGGRSKSAKSSPGLVDEVVAKLAQTWRRPDAALGKAIYGNLMGYQSGRPGAAIPYANYLAPTADHVPQLPPVQDALLRTSDVQAVERNIAQTRKSGFVQNGPLEVNAGTAPSARSALNWFNLVKPGGDWDYKQKHPGDMASQNLGNINYGATGRALGLPKSVLLRAAGAVQEYRGASDPDFGHWYGASPYGDDPQDQFMIEKGMNYYDRSKSKRPRK